MLSATLSELAATMAVAISDDGRNRDSFVVYLRLNQVARVAGDEGARALQAVVDSVIQLRRQLFSKLWTFCLAGHRHLHLQSSEAQVATRITLEIRRRTMIRFIGGYLGLRLCC